MTLKNNKLYYSNEDYDKDVKRIANILKGYEDAHLVSIYRGSIPLGVRLSNLLDLPLSIVDFQTRDVSRPKAPKLIKNDSITANQTLILLDDILDTGLTMRKVKEYLWDEFPETKVTGICLVDNKAEEKDTKDTKWVSTLRESNGEWVVFEPWEA